MKKESAIKAAIRRKFHVRKKVKGTSDRPRLSVHRTNKHIYAQIIDDDAGVTLVSASTKLKRVSDGLANGGNIKAAQSVGGTLAKEAANVGIKCVRFDRGSYKYHGRVKALAESAREAGLVF